MINPVSVTFDVKTFSVNAVKSAAFRYIHLFTADIAVIHEQVQCLLHFPSSFNEAKVQQVVNDFKKEVLDQDLRERLKAETETVRNLILAHAFSKTGLTDQ